MLADVAGFDTLRIYAFKQLIHRIDTGDHLLGVRIREAIEPFGMSLKTELKTPASLMKSASRDEYALFLMEHPFHPNAMVFRQSYLPPFWQIESTAKRWDWAVAKDRFDPEAVDRKQAQYMVKFWKNRLYSGWKPQFSGHIYIPLQGKLTTHRSFQICAPIEMIETVLAYTDAPVIAGLHPKETYHREEIAALDTIAAREPRFSYRLGGADALLAGCRFVVTQNSSVAFAGFFFEKPAVLFGQIDFNHITLNVAELGAKEALSAAGNHHADYTGFIWWFLQRGMINTRRDTAPARILFAFRARGWEI